jgi:4a-hydroxytetrahydrobiopterin dehydratase
MKKLEAKEIQQKICETENWHVEDNKLCKEFIFPSFSSAIAFVNGVAKLSELKEHHPDITILYNKVLLKVNTHSAGGITDLDFDLVKDIDEMNDNSLTLVDLIK